MSVIADPHTTNRNQSGALDLTVAMHDNSAAEPAVNDRHQSGSASLHPNSSQLARP